MPNPAPVLNIPKIGKMDHTPELKRMTTEGAGPNPDEPLLKRKPVPKTFKLQNTSRNLPLIISVTSTVLHPKEVYNIIVTRLDDGNAYKLLMTDHAPWRVHSPNHPKRALHVAAITIAGTILSLVDNGPNGEIWPDLKVSFRFGTTGCSVGNICWPIGDVLAGEVSTHLEFVLGLMGDIYHFN